MSPGEATTAAPSSGPAPLVRLLAAERGHRGARGRCRRRAPDAAPLAPVVMGEAELCGPSRPVRGVTGPGRPQRPRSESVQRATPSGVRARATAVARAR